MCYYSIVAYNISLLLIHTIYNSLRSTRVGYNAIYTYSLVFLFRGWASTFDSQGKLQV